MVQLEDLTRTGAPKKPYKTENPTLLSKYEIPVQHLEYQYIDKCQNGRELEKILHVLKSGEEGYFPHLIKTTEKRLAEIKPNSKLLRKVCPVLNKDQINKDDWGDLSKDLEDWMEDMNKKDHELEERKIKPNLHLREFDIRQSIDEQQPTITKNRKRIVSTDYKSWDKYDPDTEMLKMDLEDEKLKKEAIKEYNKNLKKPKSVRFNNFATKAEALFEANQEKERGNEYFKAGELQTALQHYTNSLYYKPLPTVYTNRALVYNKLKEYKMAIVNCKAALEIEQKNFKAHLRLAQNYETLQQYEDALRSAENAIEIDPNNIVAQELANRMRNQCEKATVNKRIVIQDVESIQTDVKDDIKSKHTIKERKNEKNTSTTKDVKQSDFSNSKSAVHDASGTNCNAKPLKTILKSSKNSIKQKDKINKVVNAIDLLDTSPTANTKFGKTIETNATLLNQKHQESLKTKNYEVISIPGTSSMPPPYYKIVHSNNPEVIKKEKQKILHRPTFLHIATIDIMSDNESEKDSNFSDTDEKHIQNCSYNVKNEDSTENFKFSYDKIGNKHRRTWNNIHRQKLTIITDAKIEEDSKGAGGEPFSDEEVLFPTEEELQSPYKFIEMWNSIRKDTSYKQHAKILKKLDFSRIHNVIGYKLDDTMLSIMFQCLYRYFMVPAELDRLHTVLENITYIPRFKVMLMFLGESEWNCIHALIKFLDQHGRGLLHNIKNVYCR